MVEYRKSVEKAIVSYNDELLKYDVGCGVWV